MPSVRHANVVTGTTYPVPPASRAPNFQAAQPAATVAPLGRHARPGPGLRLSLVGRETETKAIVAIIVEVNPFRSSGQSDCGRGLGSPPSLWRRTLSRSLWIFDDRGLPSFSACFWEALVRRPNWRKGARDVQAQSARGLSFGQGERHSLKPGRSIRTGTASAGRYRSRSQASIKRRCSRHFSVEQDQQSRLTGALRRSRRLAPAPALSSLGRRGSRVGVTRIGVKEQPATRAQCSCSDRIRASRQSCFSVATSTSPAPSSDPLRARKAGGSLSDRPAVCD